MLRLFALDQNFPQPIVDELSRRYAAAATRPGSASWPTPASPRTSLPADLLGAPSEPRAYLRDNAAKGGTLIVIGEIPYQSTLLHEREAINAIAKLAGLELHLAETQPKPFQTRLMNHVASCGLSIVLA